MKRLGFRTTLASATVFLLAATAHAQTPFPVPVPQNSVPVVPVAPVSPPPVIVTAPPVIVAPAVKAMTLREFAAAEYRPGAYSAVVQHPCTGCAVKVCFTLPVCPRRVRVVGNTVEFRWGVLLCKKVAVRFMPDGTVRVS